MQQKIVKQFKFDKKTYSDLVLSDSTKIRCNLDLFQLQLKSQGINSITGEEIYPLDTDLTVTTWVTNPNMVKDWIGFHMTPSTVEQPTGTSVGFKLNDGTNDLYWDGGAWSVAGATDWNTELEVTNNIGTFPTTDQKLGFVINLVTIDTAKTPTVQFLDVLMDCQLDYVRSLIAESLVPSLRTGLRFTVDMAMNAPGGVILSLANLETDYNIIGVEAVYNSSTDPNRLDNIFSSYSATSKTIIVSSGFVRGQNAWIRYVVEPEIFVNWGSQDYTEVATVPAVIIDNIAITGNEVRALACVNNISNNTSEVRRDPLRLSFDLTITIVAKTNRSLMSMMDKAMQHATTTQLLNWRAVDENISLQLVSEGFFRPRPSTKDAHASEYTIRLLDIYFWLNPVETKNLVQTWNLTFNKVD